MRPSRFCLPPLGRFAPRPFRCAVLALLLLLGAACLVLPANSASGLTISVGTPPALGAQGDEDVFDEPSGPIGSVTVMLHFKDARMQIVDFASYQAPATRSDGCITVQVTNPDSRLTFADALRFAVYDQYATFSNRQQDLTPLCTYNPGNGTVSIPLVAVEDLETLAVVYELSPLHPAYQQYVLNELDTTSVPLSHRGTTAALHSDVPEILASAKTAPEVSVRSSAPLARLAEGFPGVSNRHYQLNTYTRLENFDTDMRHKQSAYGFPPSMIGSYGFGVFFGSRQVYEGGVSTGTTWDQSVLKPSSTTYDSTVNALLGETIAARLGSQAQFALSREGETYRSRYLTTGNSFQDSGYSAGTAPNNKAMAHGTCGSAGVVNGGGAIMMDNAGDNYIAYKGVYQGPESKYAGWYKFFYKFDAKSASTGQSFQDVVGYVLAPPLQRGSGQAIKVSANPALSNGSSRYSLKNAVIAVYAERAKAEAASEKAAKKPWDTWQEAHEWADSKAAFAFVTKADGKSNVVEDLELGTYYATELFAPPGFRRYEGVKTLTIESRDDDTPDTVTFVDEPQRGSIDLVKVSANPKVSSGNPCYSLAGAIYTVYTDAACLNVYGALTVTADSDGIGKARIDNMPIGPYWVRETTRASHGFGIDSRTYPVTVTDGETTRVNTTAVSEPPKLDPVDLMIQKIDRHTGQPVPQGGGSLGDAHFRISYYAVEAADASALDALSPVASWVVRTDDQGRFSLQQAEQSFMHRSTRGPEQSLPYKVSGPAFFRLQNGALGMPIGTYAIQEVKAPEGYQLDPAVHVRHINDEAGDAEALSTFNAEEAGDRTTEAVVRSDIRFAKRANGSTRLAGVPFKLTSRTTGEWHILVTDKNGLASTEALTRPHSQNTNENDAQFRTEEGAFALPDAVNTEVLNAQSGVWFSGAATADAGAPPDDAQGALPFDLYELEELRCPANQSYALIIDEVIVDANDHALTIDLGTLNNTVEGTPAIHTNAFNGLTDNLTDHTFNAETEALVVDRVSYSGLTAGQEYTLEATLMDAETGEPFRAADEEVRCTLPFTPSASHGFVNVPLRFDGSGITEATRLVVFETLRLNQEEVVIHDDLANTDQTVVYAPPEEPEPEEPSTPEDPEPEEPPTPEEPTPDEPPAPEEPEKPSKTKKAPPRTPLSKTADQLAPLARGAAMALLGSALVLALVLAVRRQRD